MAKPLSEKQQELVKTAVGAYRTMVQRQVNTAKNQGVKEAWQKSLDEVDELHKAL